LRQLESWNIIILPELLGLIHAVSAIPLKTPPPPYPTIKIAFYRLYAITVKGNYFGSSQAKSVRKYPVMNETGRMDAKTRAIQNPDRLFWLNRHGIVIKFTPDSVQVLKIVRWCI